MPSRRWTAKRLVLVTVTRENYRLERPVFIGAGQRYWIDDATGELCVDCGQGRVTRHPGCQYR